MVAVMKHKVVERLVLVVARNAADVPVENDADIAAYYSIRDEMEYIPFSNDFGPYNLASTYSFCQAIERLLETHDEHEIGIVTMSDRKSIANAAFLLGAYLIMNRNMNVDRAEEHLTDLLKRAAGFCDVSQGHSTFLLSVRDCWEGLFKARSLHWVSFTADDDTHFDIESYLQLDDPLNADMHVIVPDKLIAMRGPKDLGGGDFADACFEDGSFCCRDFSPSHFADIIKQFDVQAVVRLNEPCYDPREFHEHGIAVADLFFDDCTPPSALVAAKFLAIAESVPGALAVHCKAGLGRTGTLIALYMMKHHGFSARAAMGWLRIVRPGSVIGSQQGFLVEREAAIARNRHHSVVQGSLLAPDAPVAEVQASLDHTCAVLDARFAHAAHAVATHAHAAHVPLAALQAANNQAPSPSLSPSLSDGVVDMLPSTVDAADAAPEAGPSVGSWDPFMVRLAVGLEALPWDSPRGAKASSDCTSAWGGPGHYLPLLPPPVDPTAAAAMFASLSMDGWHGEAAEAKGAAGGCHHGAASTALKLAAHVEDAVARRCVARVHMGELRSAREQSPLPAGRVNVGAD